MIPVLTDTGAIIEVTGDELLSLRLFELVYYDIRNNEFRARLGEPAAVIRRFLKKGKA